MTRQVCLWMGMSVLICGFCVSAQARQMTAFQQAVLAPDRDDALPIQYRDMRFWLFLPNEYGKVNQQWPLLLYRMVQQGDSMFRVQENVPVRFMDRNDRLPLSSSLLGALPANAGTRTKRCAAR